MQLRRARRPATLQSGAPAAPSPQLFQPLGDGALPLGRAEEGQAASPACAAGLASQAPRARARSIRLSNSSVSTDVGDHSPSSDRQVSLYLHAITSLVPPRLPEIDDYDPSS